MKLEEPLFPHELKDLNHEEHRAFTHCTVWMQTYAHKHWVCRREACSLEHSYFRVCFPWFPGFNPQSDAEGQLGFSIEFSSGHPLICWGCCGTCVAMWLSLHFTRPSGSLLGSATLSRAWCHFLTFSISCGRWIHERGRLTFVLLFRSPSSDLCASVSGWIIMTGNEGETEVTGTTMMKMVRKQLQLK